MFWYYISAIAIIFISSLAHELGHIFTLLLFKVPVHKLSIGFGPILWGKNFKKSSIKRVRLKFLPFGSAAGFDGDHPNFQSLLFSQRILLFASGAIVNFFMAGIVLASSHSANLFRPNYSTEDDPVNITRAFFVLNIIMGLFGLLPLNKFDGEKIIDLSLKKFFPEIKQESINNAKAFAVILIGLAIFNIYRFWI